MRTLTVTAKGQVTLRKATLQHLGIAPGSKVEVDERPGGEVVLPRAAKRHSVSSIFGILHRPGQRAMSVEEMDEAIALDRAEAYRRETSDKDDA